MTKTKKKCKKNPKFKWPNNFLEAYVFNRESRDKPIYSLSEITPDIEKAYAFFDDLFQNRNQHNCYSVKEIAEKKGFTHEQVLDWSKQNDLFAFGLVMLKQSCFVNAHNAVETNKIEHEKGVRYCVENMDEKSEDWEFYKSELAKIDQENYEKSEKVCVMSEEIKRKEESATLALESFTAKEQSQILEWDKKKKDIATRFTFTETRTYDPDTKVTNLVVNKEWNEDVTEDQKYFIERATLCAATGSSSSEYARILLMQVITATAKQKNDAASINATFKALLSMAPADEYEGMLISRLIVLHQQYMDMLARSTHQTNMDWKESYINSSTKLMRVYNETLEALNKHRRKGEQKVTVTHNHVNVNEGGKAIVGSEINQQPGGGDHDKK